MGDSGAQGESNARRYRRSNLQQDAGADGESPTIAQSPRLACCNWLVWPSGSPILARGLDWIYTESTTILLGSKLQVDR